MTTTDHRTTETVATAHTESSSGPSIIKKIGLIILGVLILFAIIFFYFKYATKPTTTSNKNNTADNIRQAFNAVSTSTFLTMAPPLAIVPTPTATPSPVYPWQILDAAVAPPRAPRPTRVPQNFIYNNPNLNFGVNLPPGWRAVYDQNGRVGFQNDGTRQFGYIESFQNTTGETLDSVASTLASNPNVKSIQNISVKGEPAIYYQGYSNSTSGIALIHLSKIYYLHDALITPTVVDNFRFLN